MDDPTPARAPLSERQLATLRALIDRLIPPDDVPGGWEAGAGEYLLRQLAGDLRPILSVYQAGLDALDAEARASGAAGFAELPPARQDELLGAVERGAVAAEWPIDPAAFFSAAVAHAAEGFYADPANGGNRGALAWRMVGFEVRG